MNATKKTEHQKKEKFSFLLSNELLSALRKESERTAIPISTLVRITLIDRYVRGRGLNGRNE